MLSVKDLSTIFFVMLLSDLVFSLSGIVNSAEYERVSFIWMSGSSVTKSVDQLT